ncbi:MAG TPA: OsmC family protein [Candidatus Elarobacter sp.]
MRIEPRMNIPDEIMRTATVHWSGDIAHGKGSIATESGKVKADYSFGTRFSNEPGTNPEELLGASHAACFSMALSLALTRAGHAPASIDTTASVKLAKSADGFDITRIDLTTTVVAPGLEDPAFQELASGAKAGCPISKALKAVPITLAATLKS